MDSEKNVGDRRTTITIQEPGDAKERGIAAGGAPVVVNSTKKGSKLRVRGGGAKRGVAIFDLVLRLAAIAAGFAATSLMATTDQILPFFTQFFQFHAQYNDIPTFLFFLVANAVISGYLVLSLPISIFCIVRPNTARARLLLIILDTVAMGVTVAGAASAATVLYLAHNGSSITNWNPFCQQFNNYCQQASSAVVASFVAIFMLVILIFLSAFALRP